MGKSMPARSSRQARFHPGYVYVLKAGGRYKIGRARNPEIRLKRIQAMSPVPVELACAVFSEEAPALEARMHAMFRHFRTHGEWFELDEHEFSDLWCILVGGDE